MALAAVKFDSADNFNGSAAVNVLIDDGGNGPNGTNPTGQISINVTAVNDAPTAEGLTQTLELDEDPAAIKLFTTAPTVTDLDSASVTATLTLTNAAAGVLTGAGSGTASSGGIVYKITGTPTAVEAALAAVKFDSADNFNGSAAVNVAIDDGANGPNGTNPTGQISINVAAINDAPTATNLTQTIAYIEDAVSVALDDIVVSDPDTGDDFTATLTLLNKEAGALTAGTFGTASASYDGATGVWRISGSIVDVNAALADVAFTPAANFDQDVTIATRIRDSFGEGPTEGIITLAATAVNDKPMLTGDLVATVAQRGSYQLTKTDLYFTDLDDASSDIWFTVTGQTNGKTLVNGVEATTFSGKDIDAGVVTFVNSGAASTLASFTFTLDDGDEDISAATAGTFDFSVNLPPVTPPVSNGAPTGITLSNAVVVENALAGTVVGSLGAVDPDSSDTLTFSLASNPENAFAIVSGELVVAAGANLDFESRASYEIVLRVTDAGGASFEQAFVIAVTDIDETPSTGNDLVIRGNKHDNRLLGGDGNDRIFGGRGNDVLQGNDGNDRLVGGRGDDRLRGGDGADTFVFRGGFGQDRILDFDIGDCDRILLKDVKGIGNYSELKQSVEDTEDGALITTDDGSTILIVGMQFDDLGRGVFSFL